MTKEALIGIGIVRKQFGNELHPEIASWLMLAEGVLHFFQSKPMEAYDRIRRAYGLAVAFQTESALPVCASWMAHVEFNNCQYKKMAEHICEALNKAKPDDHQAIARASLVLADSYLLAGDYISARPWYDKTRISAAAEGDQSTLSAMMHNVASLRAASVRLSDTFGIEDTKEARRAVLEFSSSHTYDFAIGTLGLDFLNAMLHGLLLTIDRNFEQALTVFGAIDLKVVHSRLHSLIYVDKAWSFVNLGKNENAKEDFKAALEAIKDVNDEDDLAYVYSRMSQIEESLNNRSNSDHYREEAKIHLAKHRVFQFELHKILEDIPLK